MPASPLEQLHFAGTDLRFPFFIRQSIRLDFG
jgi:hypothetical protein